MDKINKHIKVLYGLAIIFAVWCTYNTSYTERFSSQVNEYRTEVHTFQRQIASLIDIANAQEQQDEEIKAVEDVLPVDDTKEEVTE